jgi:hypothetical protein
MEFIHIQIIRNMTFPGAANSLAFSQWLETVETVTKFKQTFVHLQPAMVIPVYAEKLQKIIEAITLLKEAIPEFPDLALNQASNAALQQDMLRCDETMQMSPLGSTAADRGSPDSVVSFGCRSESSSSSAEDMNVSQNYNPHFSERMQFRFHLTGFIELASNPRIERLTIYDFNQTMRFAFLSAPGIKTGRRLLCIFLAKSKIRLSHIRATPSFIFQQNSSLQSIVCFLGPLSLQRTSLLLHTKRIVSNSQSVEHQDCRHLRFRQTSKDIGYCPFISSLQSRRVIFDERNIFELATYFLFAIYTLEQNYQGIIISINEIPSYIQFSNNSYHNNRNYIGATT